MVPQWVIEKKRDGHELAPEEIRDFINGFTREEIPPYQMAALAMAIYFNGMSFDEVTVLTDVMMNSGELVDTSCIELPKADKHSTGGIGDKVSLVLAPLVACCNVAVPMISGRGLGITGGTLDKLESIPGYRTDLSANEFLDVIVGCGCSITGQTTSLAPADRKLYALRDVTGTVPSIPLISASIMSKKLAEGTEALVLDVKWGKGAFMKSKDDARNLARTMVEIGSRLGRSVTAVITDMNQPLGRTAGNALEVIEAVECLQEKGPEDMMDVTLELSAQMLMLTGRVSDRNDALANLQEHLQSGAALDRFRKMITSQGGSPEFIDNPARLPHAQFTHELPAQCDGFITQADAEAIGKACVVLGAGRVKVDDKVDHAVGVSAMSKIGDRVKKGEALLALHANDQLKMREAMNLVEDAFKLSSDKPTSPPLIVETIHPDA